MSLSVTKPDMSSYSATLPEKMYEDVKEIVVAPIETVYRGVARTTDLKHLQEATTRERDVRKDLEEYGAKLAEHPVFIDSPPRRRPEDCRAWGHGAEYSEALHDEEVAARRRKEAADDYLKELEMQREIALRESQLAAERENEARKAKDNYESGKSGFFWWR